MKPSSITFVLAMATVLVFPGADASVTDTCKAIANGDPNIRYDFCVQSLSQAPGSGSADTRSLAVIAVNLSSAKATNIFNAAKRLLGRASTRAEFESLGTCLEVYNKAQSSLADSISAIRENRLADARTYLGGTLDAPTICERGFYEFGLPSPLKQENADEKQLCTIALAITSRLQ